MSHEQRNTPHDARIDSKPLQATRRTALRGAGLAGLLALGGGSATAQTDSPRSNASQDQNEPSENDETVPVTWENYPRANCHVVFQSIVDAGGFGQFYHRRNVSPSRIRLLSERTGTCSPRSESSI